MSNIQQTTWPRSQASVKHYVWNQKKWNWKVCLNLETSNPLPFAVTERQFYGVKLAKSSSLPVYEKKATNERYWSGKIAASYKYRCAMVIYSFNLYLSLSIFSQSAGQIRRAILSLPSGMKCDSAVGSEVVYILSSVYVCEMKQAGCDVLLAGGLDFNMHESRMESGVCARQSQILSLPVSFLLFPWLCSQHMAQRWASTGHALGPTDT